MNTENLITIKQAAKICGTTYHTVNRWANYRGLKTHVIAGIRLIDKIELDQFLIDSADWRMESLTVARRTGRAA